MLSDIKLQLYFARKALANIFYTATPGMLVFACLVLEPYIHGIAFLSPLVAGGSLYLGAEPGALNLLPQRFRPRMRTWLQKRAALPEALVGLPGEAGYMRKLDQGLEAFWTLAASNTVPEALDRAAWSMDQQFSWADRLVALKPKLLDLGDSSEYIIKLDTAIDVFRESTRSNISVDLLMAQAKEINDLITMVDQKMTEVARTTNEAAAQEGFNELYRVKKEILDGLSTRQQAEHDANQMIKQIKG